MNNNPPPLQPGSLIRDAFDSGWREQFVSIILRIACVVGVGVLLLSFPSASNTDRIVFSSIYLFLIAITVLKIPNVIRMLSLLLIVFVAGTHSVLVWGPWGDGSMVFIGAIVISALLFDQRVDILTLLVSVLTIAFISTLQQSGAVELNAQSAPVTTYSDWTLYIIDFSVIGVALLFAIGQFKAGISHYAQEIQSTNNKLTNEHAQLNNTIRERTEELEIRTVQLRSSTAIARTIAEIHDVAELLDSATKLTADRFGYSHVGLYLLDDRKKIAFLQASSSIAGKELVGQGFRVESNRLNLFSVVLEQKRPRIILDVDVNFVADVNFPFTRSRMMMPLTVRGNVIGMIDFHSDQSQIFSPEDAEILQSLADLIAISIDNVRLIDETKSLVLQLEETTATQTRETWTKFTSRHQPAYQYTPAGVRPLFSNNKQDSEGALNIPLTLHGQKIGGIVLKRKGVDETWSERERTLVEKVADQVALALENSRLVDETQKNAMRNQVIANISARIRETLDVESVIRTATTELRRVFDLKEAEVSIGAPQTGRPPIKKHTSSLRLRQ